MQKVNLLEVRRHLQSISLYPGYRCLSNSDFQDNSVKPKSSIFYHHTHPSILLFICISFLVYFNSSIFCHYVFYTFVLPLSVFLPSVFLPYVLCPTSFHLSVLVTSSLFHKTACRTACRPVQTQTWLGFPFGERQHKSFCKVLPQYDVCLPDFLQGARSRNQNPNLLSFPNMSSSPCCPLDVIFEGPLGA